MAPLAPLLLAACALLAPLHAATIPDTASDLQKKISAIVPEELKELPATNPENEIVGQNEPIKEIENELRIKPAEDIPVQVVIEDVAQSVKMNEVADDDEIKRPEADLMNPGPPQRQEHETQNPEQHSDEQLKVSTIKENIKQAQVLLKQSFQGVTDDIQNWIANNNDQTKIQQNIKNLRETFTSQIQKLNDTLQSLSKPEVLKPSQPEKVESQRNYQKIESRLKVLEDNFYNGVQTLSEGIHIVASLRSANDENVSAKEEPAAEPAASASPTLVQPVQPVQTVQPEKPAAVSPPQNFIVAAFSDLYNRTMTNFQNFQNSLSPSPTTPPTGVQADVPEVTTASYTFVDFINIFRPNQNLSQNPLQFWGNIPRPTLPPSFSQYIPNLTLPPFANIGSQTTAKPASEASASAAAAAASSSSSGTQTVQEAKPVAESNNPADTPAASQPAASTATTEAGGPIRQFLNNNPVVQGIAGAVQRIQNTITNQSQDTPREPAQKSAGLLEKRKPAASGDILGTGLSEKTDVKEAIPEELKKEPEDIKEAEVKPEVVLEKTE